MRDQSRLQCDEYSRQLIHPTIPATRNCGNFCCLTILFIFAY
nr:MAG TPA: hypothetical protein [Caudoviricetes sp.]